MPKLKSAAPVLASLDIERTIAFYSSRLGFVQIYSEPGVWGIVKRDDVVIHFWACPDRRIAESTSCRVYVEGVAQLFEDLNAQGLVHPAATLQSKPWGTREFGVVDDDGNLLTFAEHGA